MRDRCEDLVSFSLNFTCTSLQDTVLEKKCIVFLLITNSIKILVAMRDRCEKLVFSTHFHLKFASRHNIREEMSCLFVDNK